MGHCVIEAHKNYPAGLVELGQDLQAASNENANLRFDNIKLALNKRQLVRRSASIDIRSLKRSTPGGIVMVSDISKDTKEMDVRDVTGSTYQEQDRMSADFDEIMGTFSQSSVNTNRNLNETVGGMGLLKDNSNAITEYQLRIFSETFVKKVMEHLVMLEKAYEDDETILRFAADRVRLPEGTVIDNNILQGDTDVSVNVGFGATDPQRQIMKLKIALGTVAELAPDKLDKLKGPELVEEIMGLAGYKNGKRFFENLEEDPNAEPPQPPPEMQIEMQKLGMMKEKQDIEAQLAQMKMMVDRELGFAQLASNEKIKLSELYERLGMEKEKMSVSNMLESQKFELGVLQEIGRRQDQAFSNKELALKASGSIEQGV
jgi:hypothetical protein